MSRSLIWLAGPIPHLQPRSNLPVASAAQTSCFPFRPAIVNLTRCSLVLDASSHIGHPIKHRAQLDLICVKRSVKLLVALCPIVRFHLQYSDSSFLPATMVRKSDKVFFARFETFLRLNQVERGIWIKIAGHNQPGEISQLVGNFLKTFLKSFGRRSRFFDDKPQLLSFFEPAAHYGVADGLRQISRFSRLSSTTAATPRFLSPNMKVMIQPASSSFFEGTGSSAGTPSVSLNPTTL